MGPLGGLLGRLGAILGVLGRSWATLRCLGALLGRLEALFVVSWALQSPFFGPFDVFGAVLGLGPWVLGSSGTLESSGSLGLVLMEASGQFVRISW